MGLSNGLKRFLPRGQVDQGLQNKRFAHMCILRVGQVANAHRQGQGRQLAARLPGRSGKSSETAVGTLVVAAEAAVSSADTDKCYEHVEHRHIQEQAAALCFPQAIVRLCLAVYWAERCITWESLLQLVMIQRLDECPNSLPFQVDLAAYVDDAHSAGGGQ